MSGNIEVEAKFLSPKRLSPSTIKSFIESLGLKVGWQEPQKQRDIYWDTPEGKLIEEGMALRVRCAAGRFTATLKMSRTSDGAIFTRPEVEWQLSDQEADTFQQHDDWIPRLPPEATPDFPVDPRRLQRVLTVETLRRKAIISDAEDFRAELALDRTAFMGSHSGSKYGELELELKAGNPAQLERIAEALRHRFGLEPSKGSKFEVGMKVVGQ